jgi:nitroreductase
MSDTISELAARISVRAFDGTPLSAAERAAILSSAVQAPSAGCQQLYTILDITDAGIRAHLADLCDHQPFVAKAPMALVFCADAKKWYDAFALAGCHPRKPGAGDLLLAADDALIAAQKAVTAAWSLGVGSCYVGDVMENAEAVRTLLSLPEYVFPAALVVFGHPAPGQLQREKPPRCGMDIIVRENGYRPLSEEELRRMTAPSRKGADFYEWTQAFCRRKYDSDFSREMTRSVRRYLEDFDVGK